MYELGEYKNYNCLTSVRSALLLNTFLKVSKIGDYIAVPWNVCTEVSIAIIESGLKPYYLEINENFIVSDSEILKIPKNIKMYLHIHPYGKWFPLSEVIKKRFEIIIDDAAQAFGAGKKNFKAGFCGNIGLMSFGYSKHVNIGGSISFFKDKKIGLEMFHLLKKQNYMNIKKFEFENKKAIFKKIKDFENLKKVNWENILLNHNIISPKIEIPKLCIYLKLIDNIELFQKKRIKYANDVAKDIPSFLGKKTNLNKYDSPWRISINASHLNLKEYIEIFQTIRSKDIPISNWYYPSNLIFKKISKKSAIKKNNLQRFQFLIDKKIDYKRLFTSTSINQQ